MIRLVIGPSGQPMLLADYRGRKGADKELVHRVREGLEGLERELGVVVHVVEIDD